MPSNPLKCHVATTNDVAHIWSIINAEVQVMAQAGRTQWQNGYPNPSIIATDIEQEVGRVLLLQEHVVGYCAIVYSGEPCYDHIEGGNWLTTSHSSTPCYSVVHRLAIDPTCTGRGLATQFLSLLLQETATHGCKSMRIDTNHDNVQMLHILPHLGFTRCGKVMLADGPRIAFERRVP